MRKPIVNLEETPGKIVGSRFPVTPVEAYERLLRANRSLRPPLPYPRGVFRFKTFAEANEWGWKHLMTAATKISRRANRPSQT